ncbi:MAG: hypothetical protein ACI4KI_03530, partial [Candidatus Fimenecus sp.]
MKKGIIFDKSKKIFPIIVMAIGIVLALALFIMRLNLVAVVNVAYMCIVVALTILGILFFKKLYLWNFIGYGVSGLAIVLYYAIWGADAGFGAFSSGKAGWSSAANALFAGANDYNFFVRLGGNLLLILPCVLAILALFFVGKKQFAKKGVHFAVTSLLSLVLAGTTIFYVLTMNLRSQPNVDRLWEGHDDYLDGVDKAKEGSPNVLFILMDDMGWGDTSLNGAIYDTPNMDRIGEE